MSILHISMERASRKLKGCPDFFTTYPITSSTTTKSHARHSRPYSAFLDTLSPVVRPPAFGLERGQITPPGPEMVRTGRKCLNSNKINSRPGVGKWLACPFGGSETLRRGVMRTSGKAYIFRMYVSDGTGVVNVSSADITMQPGRV